jgi:hypothetical protein
MMKITDTESENNTTRSINNKLVYVYTGLHAVQTAGKCFVTKLLTLL